jgi:hypothetical protein
LHLLDSCRHLSQGEPDQPGEVRIGHRTGCRKRDPRFLQAGAGLIPQPGGDAFTLHVGRDQEAHPRCFEVRHLLRLLVKQAVVHDGQPHRGRNGLRRRPIINSRTGRDHLGEEQITIEHPDATFGTRPPPLIIDLSDGDPRLLVPKINPQVGVIECLGQHQP